MKAGVRTLPCGGVSSPRPDRSGLAVALVLLFGVPMNIAVGSSAFMVGLTASGGFLGHLVAGHFDWKVALMLMPGIFIGAQIGARTSVRVDKTRMKHFFGYVLAALAVFLVIRTALH